MSGFVKLQIADIQSRRLDLMALLTPHLEEAAAAIRPHMVTLISEEQPVGSGTLIRWGTTWGILTANHVAKEVFQKKTTQV
jgi:hypothetical protein